MIENICIIEVDKRENFVTKPLEVENPDTYGIVRVGKCYLLDKNGDRLNIYIRRMNPEATKNLCDYIFKNYKESE